MWRREVELGNRLSNHLEREHQAVGNFHHVFLLGCKTDKTYRLK
jgi:hypothetical protein